MQADDNCERKKKVAHIRHHLEDDGGEESVYLADYGRGIWKDVKLRFTLRSFIYLNAYTSKLLLLKSIPKSTKSAEYSLSVQRLMSSYTRIWSIIYPRAVQIMLDRP